MSPKVNYPNPRTRSSNFFTQVGPTASFVRSRSGALAVQGKGESNVIQVDPEVFAKVGPTPAFLREKRATG